MFRFELIHTSKKSKARVGKIHTPHGVINTPNFVAVGTNGTLKALDNDLAHSIGLELMFCNTYHLLLQPGPEVVAEAGGLHTFINRKLPLITDSGGFQVFSLAYGSVHNELKSRGKKQNCGSVLNIDEEGVTFRSYRDGKKILLTPESSIETQKALGADIIIPLDELPPYHIEEDDLKKSLARTHRWEMRSLNTHLKKPNQQAMYAVIHGGIDQTLRRHSCEVLTKEPFDGFAIGGSVGKNKQELFDLIAFTRPLLPDEKPNHLLGIGDLTSLKELVPLGIDTFDSSYPTKAARHGLLLTSTGGLKIEQAKHRRTFFPIEPKCTCATCQNYTVAYLHHLFKARELTALHLATIHNLHFMVQEMKMYREKILRDEI
ncbi:MAG: Queuine tRNA-ribosyltransferase [Chlamydiales bacterium]|nr:Queuine tRNA-ribosyltransferase [Chlamydiales bacterium]MCH9620265.1 Queuine tRNA-ribosyltransferase [Chlamydiales bacterium]MCH9622825.1 Queuine tRNA-ribosyltransferase [Chlamydiales bacterium]